MAESRITGSDAVPAPEVESGEARKGELHRATVLIGWVATAASVSMYVAYIDQIARNLDGVKGSALQPLASFIAATLWTLYGAGRARRDWPLIAANVPGIVLAAVAFITAL